MNQLPLCSIIILSYNQIEYTLQCLESIYTYTQDVDYEIIVIDNASTQEVVACLESRQDITLIQNKENKGFAGGCNQGIEAAKGQYILLLNNDVIVTNRWLSNMVQFLEAHPHVFMAGPLTNATVGKQMIEVNYGEDLQQMQLFAKDISKSQEKPWRTLRLVAFCVLIRRSLFDEIGMLDTRFATGNYEDDDFNLRALCVNKQAYICRNSFVHHFMNISFQQKEVQRERIMMENKIRLEDKWDNLDWNHHAAYNPYILQKVVEQKGKDILHLGCGVGALAIELKETDSNYQIWGMDIHITRSKIAEQFLDVMLQSKNFAQFLEENDKQFDVIIVEGILETFGLDVLRKLRKRLKQHGILLLRVFNQKHITTLERNVMGHVGGRLLCASSECFHYYFDDTLYQQLNSLGYVVEDIRCIKKRFSNTQRDLYERIKDLLDETEEPCIYNRIYTLHLMDH